MPQETPNFTDAAVFKHSASGFTPASGSAAVYIKSDNKLYIKDSSGTEAASGVTGAAASAADVLGVSGSDITGVDATADRIVFWDDSANKLAYLEAGSGLSISGTTLTATATGTIGGGTGSVDNALLRADGTGGSTAQAADIVIDDATTSTQNNVAIVNAHSETDSALVLAPKGTGAFIVGPKPDGTSTGGNARGVSSVCMVFARNAATQIASGANSVAIGYRATASNLQAVALCNNTASGAYSTALGGLSSSATNSAATTVGGQGLSASASYAFCGGGESNTASGSHAIAFGQLALANRRAIIAHAAGQFSAQGDAQTIRAVLRNKTTTNSAVELFTNGSSTRLTCPSGKVMAMLINITGSKSDGSAVAHYVRQYAIKNVGGTTSEVYAPVTVGTDTAASTSIALSADDTNDALKIEVTGIASETWRWVASVDAVEVAYGS